MNRIIIICGLLLLAYSLQSQTKTQELFVTQDSIAGYTQLNWTESLVNPHIISRKKIDDLEWTIIDSTFSGDLYVDSTSVEGDAFEYRIKFFDKNHLFTDSTVRVVYTYSGFEIPRIESRGRIMILVDSIHQSILQNKIDRWIKDVEGDGWEVLQETVSRSTPKQTIKSIIRDEYNSSQGLIAVFLLGHIPVVYSGYIAPDGHNDHRGAWPADVYYGEMDDNWGDQPIGLEEFGRSEILNAEIQIGRVDFYDMPAFNASEVELLENYLDKNHAFRQKHFAPKMQAIHIDNFNRGYDNNARKQFHLLVGIENTEKSNYRNSLLSDSYIWSYGAGSGTYTSAGGISNTTTMANDSLQGVFTMLFGSYFGDWDNTNNYLRSVLGSGSILTASWGTRPSWMHYHMGLGTNIGRQAIITQSKGSSGYGIQGATGMMDTVEINDPYTEIHTALLGDPTLRMHMMYPVSSLDLVETENGISLDWTYVNDSSLLSGFNIYKKSSNSTSFEYLERVPPNSRSFIDVNPNPLGLTTYMIRPEKLEVTPSGSFYNQATGLQAEINITVVDMDNDGFTNIEDCDDTNPNINPDQTEVPYNGNDDDCDPATLDDDLDQDGFLLADDCDDDNPEINPNQSEVIYNGTDDDCNPETLDDDLDQDGFILAEDCDDDNSQINPDQMEIIYNGIDDDCNAETLDDDLDEDGFLLEDDCDDTDSDINPDAEEIPNNGIDEDCDGNDIASAILEFSRVYIKVFPNPTSSKLNIYGIDGRNVTLNLYSRSGELVIENINTSSFSVGQLVSGTYFLEIIDLEEGVSIIEKIFVL